VQYAALMRVVDRPCYDSYQMSRSTSHDVSLRARGPSANSNRQTPPSISFIVKYGCLSCSPTS